MVSAAMATPAAGASVQVRAVSHAFGDAARRLPVLDDVSFDVAAGETVALLGPSGCGKSTLLRLVAGLDAPGAGRIGVDHVRVAGPDPSRLLMFQDPLLLPWRTVEANVAYGLQARGIRDGLERVGRALRLVGLGDFAGAYPHELSGGMAQRASFARALVNHPRVLLLDEPFGKLDSLTRMTMQEELLALARRHAFTTVLVTHDVEEALLLATRVLVFSPRPARIIRDIDNGLPFPRLRDDPAFIARRREILIALGHGEEFAR
ncbi:ABC transporter ATP-binding protein [Gluconacetobacter sacchari]|uniref:ABC transporter ATP-binding protein n=2 Tax=Gluconacetobacter sacchari TaxID=92759 RepID=A0A7W4NPS2_9PROT|nr:ABC transporter ATP-binding protein [Gluconacetobacter sacchari]MBB2161921.1 ABC transporter ATP-binding protein [Gluconacetobacter sacchari]GBQ29654.1 nitrate/sulfonate/bicarbonate transporter ATP-binding protein [Gluconacetobacter sacchari DSM 12717]